MGLRTKKELISSAEVVDKHLILSLPNAVDPIVWRMALDKIGTASFEVKQAKDNSYKLVLKPKKGTAEVIANFNKKEETLDALIRASDALQKPELAAIPQSNSYGGKCSTSISSHEKKSGAKWFYLLIWFLVLVGLYAYMSSLIPKKINTFGGGDQENVASQGAPQSQAGVPLSADDFLNGL